MTRCLVPTIRRLKSVIRVLLVWLRLRQRDRKQLCEASASFCALSELFFETVVHFLREMRILESKPTNRIRLHGLSSDPVRDVSIQRAFLSERTQGAQFSISFSNRSAVHSA